MHIGGTRVSSPNYILRFSVLVFSGIISVSCVLFWKSQLLFAAEYQELPVTHEQIKLKKENKLKQQKMAKGLLKNKTLED